MINLSSSLLLGYRTQVRTSDVGFPGVITSLYSYMFLKFFQLIIPEASRALPAFILALQKTKPLKGDIVL